VGHLDAPAALVVVGGPDALLLAAEERALLGDLAVAVEGLPRAVAAGHRRAAVERAVGRVELVHADGDAVLVLAPVEELPVGMELLGRALDASRDPAHERARRAARVVRRPDADRAVLDLAALDARPVIDVPFAAARLARLGLGADALPLLDREVAPLG